MSSPQTGSVTLTSSGTSSIIQLDPMARVTSVHIVGSSGITSTSTQGAVADVTVQMTLNTWVSGGSSQYWSNVSTTHYNFGVGSTSSTPGITGDGILLTLVGPIAGLRLSSTTWVPTTIVGTLTLKALQSITAGP